MTANLAWSSFWDLIGPQEAALLLKELYGASAPRAAAQCAAAAKNDDRESDHLFWLAVSAELTKGHCVASCAPQSILHRR
jgi:hypothetical protein